MKRTPPQHVAQLRSDAKIQVPIENNDNKHEYGQKEYNKAMSEALPRLLGAVQCGYV